MTTGAYSNPSQHQTYNALPKLDAPLIDEKGNISIIWYKFFINLFNMVGSSKVSIPNVQVIQASSTGVSIIVSPSTGQTISEINTQTTTIEATSTLPILPPPDQARSQFIPGTPMDQIRYSNIVNQALSLEL